MTELAPTAGPLDVLESALDSAGLDVDDVVPSGEPVVVLLLPLLPAVPVVDGVRPLVLLPGVMLLLDVAVPSVLKARM